MLWPIPGTVVYVWFLGVFRHKGIVSNRWRNGKPMVIANSWTSNGVAEIPWNSFAGTQTVYMENSPSSLSALEVLYNARCMLGERYDPILSNCEHFVAKSYGLEPRSPQLAAVAIVAALAAVLAIAARA